MPREELCSHICTLTVLVSEHDDFSYKPFRATYGCASKAASSNSGRTSEPKASITDVLRALLLQSLVVRVLSSLSKLHLETCRAISIQVRLGWSCGKPQSHRGPQVKGSRGLGSEILDSGAFRCKLFRDMSIALQNTSRRGLQCANCAKLHVLKTNEAWNRKHTHRHTQTSTVTTHMAFRRCSWQSLHGPDLLRLTQCTADIV